ncbi:MAG TPA: hypothetical protein VGJ33_07085 [Candidatus Angelobacter sp.]|jgi:hypothetical protein
MHEPALGVSDPNQPKITWEYVLTRSYRLYAQRFWTYFRIAVLPAIIAYGFHYLERLVYPPLFHGVRQWSRGFFLLLLLQVWIEGAVYWTISAFFFAAIAANVLGTIGDSRLADAYSPARARLRPAVALAVLTWTLFWIGRIAGAFAVSQLLGRYLMNYWVETFVLGILFLVLATLLSKFGLTIPALMDDSFVSFRHALRESVRQTEHWELFFMLFLIKSALIAYGAYWLCDLALGQLWQHGLMNSRVDPYLQWLIAIVVAAMLESPLFIAFAVLYRELNPRHGPKEE